MQSVNGFGEQLINALRWRVGVAVGALIKIL